MMSAVIMKPVRGPFRGLTTARRRNQFLHYSNGRTFGFPMPRPTGQSLLSSSMSSSSRSFRRHSSTIPQSLEELSQSSLTTTQQAPSSSSTATITRTTSSSSYYFDSTDHDDDDVPSGPVTERLKALVTMGSIQPDQHQLVAARELDRVYHDLMEHDPPPLVPSSWSSSLPTSSSNGNNNNNNSGTRNNITKSLFSSSSISSSSSSSTSFFGNLFGRASAVNAVADAATASLGLQSSLGIPGCYLYGGVGCGKTFLMDLLYQSIGEESDSAWADDRQMVHYHKFMLNVHQFMHTSRKEQHERGITNVNLIDPVVAHILERGRFLCLDEFQVTDVADAMILKEVFTGLWKQGCVLVTTSNRPPRDLYLHGLQRDRFVPFIDMLEKKCTVVSLMDNETDYRMMMSEGDQLLQATNDSTSHTYTSDSTDGIQSSSIASTTIGKRIVPKKVYFTKGEKKELQKLFADMTKDRPCNPTTLETQGRKVKIPMACQSKSVAMFSFEDLCQKALGAADYLVIGQQFSTVFLYGIPKLTVNELNWLRRFITFVDSMYELKVSLVLQTNVDSIDTIFTVDGDKGAYSQDEVFAFDRTRSRLQEMSSAKYLTSRWLGPDAGGSSNSPVTARLGMEPSLADHPHSR